MRGRHGEIAASARPIGAAAAPQGVREVGAGMDCQDARLSLLEYQRRRLRSVEREEVQAHLDSCAHCVKEDAVERALSEVLEQRVPQFTAPLSLKRRLAADWPDEARMPSALWSRWGKALVPA